MSPSFQSSFGFLVVCIPQQWNLAWCINSTLICMCGLISTLKIRLRLSPGQESTFSFFRLQNVTFLLVQLLFISLFWTRRKWLKNGLLLILLCGRIIRDFKSSQFCFQHGLGIQILLVTLSLGRWLSGSDLYSENAVGKCLSSSTIVAHQWCSHSGFAKWKGIIFRAGVLTGNPRRDFSMSFLRL